MWYQRRFNSRRFWAATAAGLLGFALVSVGVLAAVPRPDKAEKPHWKATTCGECHTIENGRHLPITPEQADEICLRCHDGRRAVAEFHPVGREFDDSKYVHPEKWPLVNGRLGCLTCHDMQLGCAEDARRPQANRMVLRDYQVGRKNARPFCQNCHKESEYRKLDPHVMLLGDRDEIVEDKCLFCHTKPLDRKALVRTGDSALKADQDALCRDCHPTHKDPMQQGHIGLRISDNMLATMYVREIIGLSAQVKPPMVAQIKAAGNKPTLMIPDKDGRIVCSTCHNPHQAGVFPRASVLAYRAMRLSDKGHLASPVRGRTWCRHCHAEF
jgi:hypothetical protein